MSATSAQAIAWRVGAVSGSRVGLVLAPALLAFHGFGAGSALLPVGLGLTGVVGWVRRLPKHVAAAGSVGVATGLVVASVAVGSAWRGGGGGDAAVLPPATADGSLTLGQAPDDRRPSADTSEPDNAGGTPSPTVADTTTSTTPTSTTPPTTPPSTPPTTPPITLSTTPTRLEQGLAPSTTGVATLVSATSLAPLVTTAPSIITAVGPTTAVPTTAAVTTAVPTTLIVMTTTTTAPTTTGAPTTTAVSTTSAPTTVAVISPGTAAITEDRTIGVGNQVKKRITVSVTGLTGAPGRLVVGTGFTVRSATNLTCDGGGCALGGVVAPAVAAVELETAAESVVFTLRDGAGTVLQTLVSP